MTSTLQPKPADRVALIITVVLGIAAGVVTIVQAVIRIIQIVPNRDVPVTVAFADTPATLPIGPGGSQVAVVPQQVEILASDMAPITVFSLIAAEIVYALAVVVAIVCVSLVIRNILRGEAFGKANVGLVGTLTFAVAIGWILTWLFRTMGANGAASALAGEYPENTAIPIALVVPFAIAALGALSAAFVAGNRLQRETEGLV